MQTQLTDDVIYYHFIQACANSTVSVDQMTAEYKQELKKIFSTIKFKGGKLTLIDEFIESVI